MLRMGVYADKIVLENCLALPTKVEHIHTLWYSNFILGTYPREMHMYMHQKTAKTWGGHPYVHQ